MSKSLPGLSTFTVAQNAYKKIMNSIQERSCIVVNNIEYNRVTHTRNETSHKYHIDIDGFAHSFLSFFHWARFRYNAELDLLCELYRSAVPVYLSHEELSDEHQDLLELLYKHGHIRCQPKRVLEHIASSSTGMGLNSLTDWPDVVISDQGIDRMKRLKEQHARLYWRIILIAKFWQS